MPESSLQYAVPSAKKEKAGGEGSGKRLWENRKWRKFFRQVSLKIGNSGAQQRLDPPPSAKQIGHAPQPAVWSADKERQPLPVSGDAERPLPDARRDVPGRPEG